MGQPYYIPNKKSHEEKVDQEKKITVDQQLDQKNNQQEIAKKNAEWGGIKTTLFTDPNTSQKWPIPVSVSPTPTVGRILRYIDRTGFMGILNIGMSGTGKSTWSRMLVHMLHQQRHFIVHWYSRDDIQHLDQAIKSLEKGLNHIMVFDDASFSLDKLKKEDVMDIAQKLTYIRHEVKGQVIIMMNIHYSKAIQRFFRNVPFVFLTSITMEEVNTFMDTWPHGKWKFRDFAYYFHSMMMNGSWEFEVDKWAGKHVSYATDKPFRLGVAMEGNHIHFFFYLKTSCSLCDPSANSKRQIDSDQFVDHFVSSYGKDRARAMLRWYAFTRHGKKVIDSKRLAIWHTIAEYDKNNRIDWDVVNNVLDNTTTRKRRRTYLKKGQLDQDMKELSLNAKPRPESKALKAEVREEILSLRNSKEELSLERQDANKEKKKYFDPDNQYDQKAELQNDPNDFR